MKILKVLFGLICLIVALGFIFKDKLLIYFFKPTQTAIKNVTTPSIEGDEQIQVIADHLDIPWEIVFLPDGSLLVTERPGRLLRISGTQQTTIEVGGVKHVGEGGLLGLALHPDFTTNHWIYLYATTQTEDGLINRVDRYTFDIEKNQLSDNKTIVAGIPGAANHDGGRIAFGPDRLLYITTGDAQQEKNAQDTQSLAGKILRVTDDGGIPADNPFNNMVYSYGHRNPQGLAWDKDGRLWATEHGPSGVDTGYDELNIIEKGANYGWPVIKGDQQHEEMKTPVINSGSDDTWAPAGTAIIGDRLFFTGLRGQSLYGVRLTEVGVENLETYFREEYGRLRVVTVGPDEWLYLATSNTDGRGTSKPNDDRIIKIPPSVVGITAE
jgi:glucose/arabinose dehydrogenase